ncbi:hypothetical protein E5361_04630 [Histophilus somni]|uniref:hypothetical protein n=1 Tax=Histophilus somni TaxID=731 RepID=UPI00109D335C|nr:hypothetical protein [Histophilus somni]THA21709.1 hypothetical protein E5361_04630 [Histophilus somni]
MKSFTLILTATFDFRDDEFNDIGFKWSSIDGKALLDAPRELDFTIYKLMKDCTYALPILSHFLRSLVKRSNPSWQLQACSLKGKMRIGS